MLLSETRDLLGMVIASTQGVNSEDGRVTIQDGVISALPSFIKTVNAGLRPSFLTSNQIANSNYSTQGRFNNQKAALTMPFDVDPMDLELKTATWFKAKGIQGQKPNIKVGFSYDTNTSHQANQAHEASLIQTTQLNIPFTYGIDPGSSIMANLNYRPSYLTVLAGPDENQLEHDILFHIGRAFRRSALGLNNQTSISAAPLRELTGRARVISNRTSLLGVYDVSPKSLIRFGIGHSFSTRSGILNSPDQTITVDDIQADYKFLLSPKIDLDLSGLGSVTKFKNEITPSERMSVGMSYSATAKMSLNLTTGYSWRQPQGNAIESSQLYSILVNYSPGPKTIIQFGVDQDVRQSFADEGIFLTENRFLFNIRKALLLRWQMEFSLDYAIRSENDSENLVGLRQKDIGYNLNFKYFMNTFTIIQFSALRFKLTDQRADTISTRLSFSISVDHAF